MPTRRQQRVAEQIHRELSSLLMFEVHDPRLEGITITGVDLTPDLLLARVYFDVADSEDGGAGALAALGHAKGYLRTQVAERIQLRFAPDLIFRVDTSAERGRRVDELLDALKENPAGARSADAALTDSHPNPPTRGEGDVDSDEPGPE